MLLKIGNKNYRKTVFMVVYRIAHEGVSPAGQKNKQRKYLILKRKLHWRGYEFPKGGIEDGETELDAVKREVFEETGLEIKKITNHKKIGKYDYSRKLPDRKDISGQAYSLYSVEVGEGDVIFDSHEHSGYMWESYLNALKILSKPNQKECLKLVEFS
jgi:bis(5'-nucleosidyl)-tetraphosphatase